MAKDIDINGQTGIINIPAGTYRVYDSKPGEEKIQIRCAEGVNLTLDSVSIHNWDACPLKFTGAGNTLMLLGASTITAHADQPGICVEAGTSLAIGGTGTLKVTGGKNAAGIGGGKNGNSGTIIIKSGAIMAAGGEYGAGIGGGSGGDGGTTTIKGGRVARSR